MSLDVGEINIVSVSQAVVAVSLALAALTAGVRWAVRTAMQAPMRSIERRIDDHMNAEERSLNDTAQALNALTRAFEAEDGDTDRRFREVHARIGRIERRVDQLHRP